MRDMHCHILPGVDDGAEFYEEAKEMVDIAQQNGTVSLTLTPHFVYGNAAQAIAKEELRERFDIFKHKISGVYPDMELFFGAENYMSDRLDEQIRTHNVIPLNDTDYVLIEFDFEEQIFFAERSVEKLLDAGYRPIIAHPERYGFFYQNTERLNWFIERGCLFQMNAGSPLGTYGQRAEQLSYWMLNNGQIHCIGSDAHSPYQRTPDLSSLHAFISMHFSRDYKSKLFWDNPESILAGKDLQKEEDEIL